MGTGDYKVGELAAQDSVLKDLDIGTHFLECTTAGTIAIPSRQSHGCWEFDMYKGGDAGVFSLYFINSSTDVYPTSANTYLLQIEGNEKIFLYETNTSNPTALLETATSYIDINTWYRLKVTRTTDGEFTVLIKGGSFTATIGYDGWTLVQPTGESLSGDPLVYTNNPVTDNTYTTSEYCVLDLDASDKCTNLLFKNQKKVD